MQRLHTLLVSEKTVAAELIRISCLDWNSDLTDAACGPVVSLLITVPSESHSSRSSDIQPCVWLRTKRVTRTRLHPPHPANQRAKLMFEWWFCSSFLYFSSVQSFFGPWTRWLGLWILSPPELLLEPHYLLNWCCVRWERHLWLFMF